MPVTTNIPIIRDHLKFVDNGGHLFRDWEGHKRAYFMPDNVMYIAPSGHRYLCIGNFPEDTFQSILYTSDQNLDHIGYTPGKQYYQIHFGRGFMVYAFTPAFSEVRYKPEAWFDHIAKHPDEIIK